MWSWKPGQTAICRAFTYQLHISDNFTFVSAFVRVTGNYFEIRKGTASILTAITNGCDQAQMEVQSNRIFGDGSTGSIAVDAASNGYVYTLEASHNSVARFARGFDIQPGSSPLGGASSEFQGNVFALG